jgi:hypothetical protein
MCGSINGIFLILPETFHLVKNMKINFKQFIPHGVAILSFVLVACIYFYPTLEGSVLKQGDVKQYRGMSKELEDYRIINEEEGLWTNAMFGGMPGYQISVMHEGNLMAYVNQFLHLGLPRPAGMLFIAMLGFYIFALCLRINPWLGTAGAMAFGLSTINILYIGAGHLTKVNSIAYMAPALGGLILAFRGRWLLGAAIFGLFFSLNLSSNHLQMTYYLAWMIAAVAISETIMLLIRKEFLQIGKVSAALIVAGILGILTNWGNLSSTLEYSKYTTRGATDLTIKPKGTTDPRATQGLNKDYILEYNYGKGEILSIIAPNAKGAKNDMIGNDEDAMEDVDPQFSQQIAQMDHYWGGQRMSGGAFYFGVVMFVFFVFGMIFLKDAIKWPFLVLTILAILLASNDPGGINDFFINKIPLYNKFRDSKMILVMLQVMIPAIGIMFLDKMMDKKDIWGNNRAWLIGAGGLVLLGVILYAAPSVSGSFIKSEEIKMFDDAMKQVKEPAQIDMYNGLKQELIKTRTTIYKSEMGRTFLLILVGCGIILSLVYWKVNRMVISIIAMVFVAGDNFSVSMRYLNNEGDGEMNNAYESIEVGQVPYIASVADGSILAREKSGVSGFDNKLSDFKDKMASSKLYGGIENATAIDEMASYGVLQLYTNYRVLNFGNPFNETNTSFFHKSIGGYHGAKLKRYQEMIDFHITDEMGSINSVIGAAKNQKLREYSMKIPIAQDQAQSVFDTIQVAEIALPDTVPVLNMLNTKYFILDPSKPAIKNTNANGAAWFVNGIKKVGNSNDEMKGLYRLNTKEIAVVNESFSSVKQPTGLDSNATIKLVSYHTKTLKYASNHRFAAPAIFSEIWYPEGWNCYIDGKQTESFRANYILRGVMVPAGKHTIEWKFEPATFQKAQTLAYIGSLGILLGFLVVLGLFFKEKNGLAEQQENQQ